MIRPLIILLALSLPAYAQDDEWKAPPKPKPVRTITWIEIQEVDTRVIIEPYILKAYEIRSGAKVSPKKAYEIIDADRSYRRSKLK